MTQRKAILNHLQRNKKGITSQDAILLYGCTRLASQIRALKDKGYDIVTTREIVKTRYGTTSVARYTLNV